MSMEKMEFDPMLGANKPEKEFGREQVIEAEKLMPQNDVYDPKTGEFVSEEDPPFGKNEGHLVLEEGDEKIAKSQILPLSNILEAGKKIIREEAEEFSENTEE